MRVARYLASAMVDTVRSGLGTPAVVCVPLRMKTPCGDFPTGTWPTIFNVAMSTIAIRRRKR